jgi:hypothetical protein
MLTIILRPLRESKVRLSAGRQRKPPLARLTAITTQSVALSPLPAGRLEHFTDDYLVALETWTHSDFRILGCLRQLHQTNDDTSNILRLNPHFRRVGALLHCKNRRLSRSRGLTEKY